MLDADHVPMPDALDAMVGYFDDERMALVQSPHDFFNHDSVQHYVVGRHEQSLFYRVICPGKDRHGAAYWCGSAALIRREALLEIGGVATETIAEDFHTTIRLQRHGWEYLLPRRGPRPGPRPARPLRLPAAARPLGPRREPGGLFRPARGRRRGPRSCDLRQRLSHFASLAAYLAPPMRLLLLLHPGPGAVHRRAADEDQRGGAGRALVALRDAQPRRRLRPRPRLHEDRRDRPLRAADDGDLHPRPALHLLARPHRLQGDAWRRGCDGGGLDVGPQAAPGACSARCCSPSAPLYGCSTWPASGRSPTCPASPPYIVPVLGLVELRRVMHTLARRSGGGDNDGWFTASRAKHRAACYSTEGGRVAAWLVDASPAGIGLIADEPLELGAQPRGASSPAPRRRPPAARGRRQGRDPLLPRLRRRLPDRGDDPGHRPRLADVADGVVLRRLQPRAPARPLPLSALLPKSSRSSSTCADEEPALALAG